MGLRNFGYLAAVVAGVIGLSPSLAHADSQTDVHNQYLKFSADIAACDGRDQQKCVAQVLLSAMEYASSFAMNSSVTMTFYPEKVTDCTGKSAVVVLPRSATSLSDAQTKCAAIPLLQSNISGNLFPFEIGSYRLGGMATDVDCHAAVGTVNGNNYYYSTSLCASLVPVTP